MNRPILTDISQPENDRTGQVYVQQLGTSDLRQNYDLAIDIYYQTITVL